MLSPNKVKLHGISDRRWTVEDKLSQYKGLIKLYSRDNKILQHDLNVEIKQQVRTMKNLAKDIVSSRQSFYNAVGGDRQRLRNSLRNHKDLQLAYQDLQTETVVESIHQNNFNKRKELDRIKFQMKLKKKRLIDAKMKRAELEDRVIYVDLTSKKLALDRQAEVVTGKVQDALLKQEAAISVKYTFQNILDILKKDSYYFDALLDTLHLDSRNQANCLHRTIELGQLATEYLNDRSKEFSQFANQAKMNRRNFETSMEMMRQQMRKVATNLKSLIRRESDTNVLNKKEKKTEAEETLISEIGDFYGILWTLQEIVMAPIFEKIYPCLSKQRQHDQLLGELVKTVNVARDNLQVKKNHAQVKLNNLYYNMVDMTLEYMNAKKSLKEKIKVKEAQLEVVQKKFAKLSAFFGQLHCSLQHLTQTLIPVGADAAKTKVDSDEKYLLQFIRTRVEILNRCATVDLSVGNVKNAAAACFMKMISKTRWKLSFVQEEEREDFLDNLVIEDGALLTRADLKRESKEIVDYYKAIEAELFFAQQQQKKKR